MREFALINCKGQRDRFSRKSTGEHKNWNWFLLRTHCNDYPIWRRIKITCWPHRDRSRVNITQKICTNERSVVAVKKNNDTPCSPSWTVQLKHVHQLPLTFQNDLSDSFHWNTKRYMIATKGKFGASVIMEEFLWIIRATYQHPLSRVTYNSRCFHSHEIRFPPQIDQRRENGSLRISIPQPFAKCSLTQMAIASCERLST